MPASELSYDEVFGATGAPSPSPTPELSYDAVFGKTKELSYSDVFGNPSTTPATDKALQETPTKAVESFSYKTPAQMQVEEGKMIAPFIEKPMEAAAKTVVGTARGFPEFVKMVSNPFSVDTAKGLLSQGVQTASQMQTLKTAPTFSQEWWDAAIPLGAMASGEVAGVAGSAPAIEKPPIQEVIPDAIQRSDAQVQAREPALGVETRPQSEVPQPSDSNNVVGETQGTQPIVAGAPQEAPQLTEPTPSGPKLDDVPAAVSVPESAPAAEPTGISQARTEAELGPGSVEPGIGAELGAGIAYGRDYLNKGGDPRLPIRRAQTSGLVGQREVGIVHAELERLRGERNKAAAIAEANPNDPAAQAELDVADQAQRNWRKELQPVLTKASDALREGYATSLVNPDVGTYRGLADLMDEHFKGKRDITPEDRTYLQKVAKGVQDTRKESAGAVDRAITSLEKKTPKRMTPEQLHSDIARILSEEVFKDCAL